MRSRKFPGICALLCLALTAGQASAQSADEGKRQYEARCVGCHGSDGAGGGHGPNIVDVRNPRATTREALRAIIIKGLPELGMPAFPMPVTEADAIAGYVEALKAPAAEHPAEGDVAAGEQFFLGEAKCSTCHMVRGRGGILGPDLTNLGGDRKLREIEQSLKDHPGKVLSLRMRDGQMLRGIAKYENPFDIGLQTLDGEFRSISKNAVSEVTREPSLMPKVDAPPAQMRNLLAYLTRLAVDPSPHATQDGQAEMGKGVEFSQITRPERGEWPTYHGQLGGNRHSPLDQIDVSNVAQLAPKWIFPIPTGSQRALQMTPVVVDGLMYVTAVNSAWALDARTGRQVWQYRRPRTPGVIGDAGGGINRGVAVLGDRVFMVTDHAHLIALHRLTGQLLWDSKMADYREHYGATGAPLVVNDLVISGISGGDEGVRGFLDAYKASTGERVWRFWTIPARGEPGSETWVGKALEHGCGATWLTGTYDPEAKLLYWPTGNPCPDHNGDERKGDNLYSDSILALDPETGKLKWHYQFTPHDLHDWDATETPMLVDAQFRGRPRKLLLQGNRNGFFYVLDRLTGELLLAEPFVKNLTWASGIGADGRPKLLPGNDPTAEGTKTCPSVAGATNWPSTAFHPGTGLFYLFAQESCNIYTKNAEWWIEGKSFYGGGSRRAPGGSGGKFLRALDIETGKIAWEIPDIGGGILASGLMSTAGGLLFYGDSNGGAFVAADAKTGKLLWHFNTSQGWKAGPMSYAIDGKQYIAMTAGSSVIVFSLP